MKVCDRNERLSVLESWRNKSRVVEELRGDLNRFAIGDIEFEEWKWKDIEKVIKERRKEEIDRGEQNELFKTV